MLENICISFAKQQSAQGAGEGVEKRRENHTEGEDNLA